MDVRLQKKIMINFILLGFFFLAHSQTFIPPPNSPLANGEHPRLFFTQNSLPDIRDYVNTYESFYFQTFIDTKNGEFNDDLNAKSRNKLLFDASNYAFLSYAVHSGLFSSYSFGKTAAQYATEAFDHILEIDDRVRNDGMREHRYHISNSNGGYIALALATVYDWCYNYLSVTQKQFIVDLALFMRARDYNNGCMPGGSSGSMPSNGLSECFHIGMFMAMAAYGDNELGSPYVDSLNVIKNTLKWWGERKLLNMAEFIHEGMTGTSEGPKYFLVAQTHTFFFVDAFRTAIGQNLFSSYNFLKYMPMLDYWYVQPYYFDDGVKQGFWKQRNGDIAMDRWDGDYGHLAYGHFSVVMKNIKNSDPNLAQYYQWILQDSEWQIPDPFPNKSITLYWLFYKFIWGIKDIPSKNPDQAGIKNSYRFGKGEVIMRSDLTTQNATKINFYSTRWTLWTHNHKDYASFAIHKYGNLALDAGNAKGTASGYYGLPRSYEPDEPIFHNVLALYKADGSNKFYEHRYGGVDNADSASHVAYTEGGSNHIGTVKAIDLEGIAYDYVDYDYSRTYKLETYLRTIRRKLLYIRDPNAPDYSNNEEYVLVYDYADVTDPNIKKRWLLHTGFQPQIVDGNWNQNGAGFWTSNSGSLLEVTNNYGNSHGKMFLKVLAPNNYQLRLRGGESNGNYYWYTDADGNDLYKSGNMSGDGRAIQVGAYRLEIEDLNQSNVSRYLTVMQVGDANTMTTMVPVTKIETSDFMGALINDDRIAFFNKSLNPAYSITYSFNSNKTVRHFITGLKHGNYNVEVNGTLISGYDPSVDENGILYFEYNGGGNFNVYNISVGINEDGSHPQGFELKQNYPNPFNPETIIEYQLPKPTAINLKIIDIRGELVRTLVDSYQPDGTYTVKWDGKNENGAAVGSGMYFYQIQTALGTKSRKMLLVK